MSKLRAASWSAFSRLSRPKWARLGSAARLRHRGLEAVRLNPVERIAFLDQISFLEGHLLQEYRYPYGDDRLV